MKKVLVLSSLFALSAFAAEWTGAISEATCAGKHTAGSDKDIACVTKCVKGGSAPVFISDGKVIKIANADKVMDHLGHKVTITGKLDGDTVTIDSLKMAN